MFPDDKQKVPYVKVKRTDFLREKSVPAPERNEPALENVENNQQKCTYRTCGKATLLLIDILSVDQEKSSCAIGMVGMFLGIDVFWHIIDKNKKWSRY